MDSIKANTGLSLQVLGRPSAVNLVQAFVYTVTIPREAIIVSKPEEGNNKLFLLPHRQQTPVSASVQGRPHTAAASPSPGEFYVETKL